MRRKWLGNLIPALVWFPLALGGVAYMAIKGEAVGLGLWMLIAATILGWLAVNFFGLYQNKKMKRQVARILEARGLTVGDAWFVGVATPRYSSMLDPHEEVGYLFLRSETLEFISETKTIELFKNQIAKVRYRANVHTLLALGRWVSVEGSADGKPIRLLIEPRESQALIGNLLKSKKLRQKIKRWLVERAAAS